MGQRRLGAARAAVEQRLDALFGTGPLPPGGGSNRNEPGGDGSGSGAGCSVGAGRAAHDEHDSRRIVRWRVDPGRRAAAAMIAAVAVTAVLVGWRVLADRPQAQRLTDSSAVTVSMPVPGPTPAPTGGAPSATGAVGTVGSTRSGPVGSSGSSAPIVVDVVGKVRRPGIVTLPAGSRVDDAVRSAGGALPGTNLTAVNLARLCVDGEQIAIGQPGVAASAPAPASGTTSVAGSPGASGGLVNLNTASTEQLDALPGVGPVMAQRILDWRTTHGSFQSVDQLKQVSGIGDAKYADLSPLVTV